MALLEIDNLKVAFGDREVVHGVSFTIEKGETLAGVIITENQASLTLRNQVGDFEIKKDDIATRENTRRSLMPEGLEQKISEQEMADLIAFLKEAQAAEPGPRVPLDIGTEPGLVEHRMGRALIVGEPRGGRPQIDAGDADGRKAESACPVADIGRERGPVVRRLRQ